MRNTSFGALFACLSFLPILACGGNGGDGGAAGQGGSGQGTSTVGSGASSSVGSGGNGSTSTSTGGGSGCAASLPTFADGKTPSTTLYVQAGAMAGGDGSQAKVSITSSRPSTPRSPAPRCA